MKTKVVKNSNLNFCPIRKFTKIEFEKEQRELAERKTERTEREWQRQHELAKIKATQEADTLSLNSNHNEVTPKILLENIMQKKKSNMALFLTFQRQAVKAKIDESGLSR